MGNTKSLKELGEKLKETEDSYHYRKLLCKAKELAEKKVHLPCPAEHGNTTDTNPDPYDDYYELKKMFTRESYNLDGKLHKENVGAGDKQAAFRSWYKSIKEKLEARGVHNSLEKIFSPASEFSKDMKRLSRRISVLPGHDLSKSDNWSSHILIMWIMQAMSRSRAGGLARVALMKTIGSGDEDFETIVCDLTVDSPHKAPTHITIEKNRLNVEIVTVLGILRPTLDEFECNVLCKMTTSLNLDKHIFTRQLDFDFLTANEKFDHGDAKVKKKCQKHITIRMKEIDYKKDTQQLKYLGNVYPGTAENSTNSSVATKGDDTDPPAAPSNSTS